MADTSIAPGSGINYPQDASIDELTITSNSGIKIDVKYLLVDFSLYEDIYSFAMSGYMVLKDGLGLIENLKLEGNEDITINFGKTKGYGIEPQVFKLYSIPRRDPVGNLSTEYIKLHFCSEQLLLSEQTKFTKSYKGMQISDIVDDIMALGLNIPSKRRYIIQPTLGVYDFIIPTLKPLEAISWLSNYARPATGTNNMNLADMLFFQTQDGFIFKSLSSMYSDPVYTTYKYQQQNINTNIEPLSEDVISVLDYQFVRTFDSLKEISSGSFANRLISLDPLTRSVTSTVFDYTTNIKTTLNPESPFISGNKAYNGCLKMATSNAGQMKKAYIPQGAVSHDIFIESFVPNRTAQLSLSNHTVVKIRIPGDPFVTAGKVVNFNLPSLDGNKGLDKLYSGKYLVTAVRHMIQSPSTYQTVLELAKESIPKGL